MENEFAEVFCMANVKTNYTKCGTEYRHGHRITERAPSAPLFGGKNPLTAACGRCKWLRPINSVMRFTFCGYLYETGQKRGCPPGADCMRKEELPPSETDGSGTSAEKAACFEAKSEAERGKAACFEAKNGTEREKAGCFETKNGTERKKTACFKAKDETEPDKAARRSTDAAENCTREVQTA